MTPVAEMSPQRQLCDNLGNGLHAMAQPLTVLRGALGALMMRPASGADNNRYLELSNMQVERLCSLMSGLRELLDAAQSDPVCEQIDLWELLSPMIDSILQNTGVRIAASKPSRHIEVIGDHARTGHAFQAVLTAARAQSSRGDVIHVDLLPHDGFLDVTVQGQNARGKSLGSVDRFYLSLAEANIRSQGGLYECVEDPFRVSLKLPLHDADGQDTEAASPFYSQDDNRSTSDSMNSIFRTGER